MTTITIIIKLFILSQYRYNIKLIYVMLNYAINCEMRYINIFRRLVRIMTFIFSAIRSLSYIVAELRSHDGDSLVKGP